MVRMAPELDTNPNDPINDDRTVCFCNAVLCSDLVKAIRGGAKTLDDIQNETRASTGCGGCEVEVLEILEDELTREKGE